MTELALVEEVLPPDLDLFFEETSSADLRKEIDDLLDGIHNHEIRLATSYVKLGGLLLRVRSNKKWIDWGYKSWGSYIDDLREKAQKGRSQIYEMLGVVEKLTPMIEAETLEDIGISKARELKRFVVSSGRTVNHHLLETALNPKVGIDELRAECFKEMHGTLPEKGKFFNIGGFFTSEDEEKELNRGYALARMIDPAISSDTPEPQAMLEIQLRLVREFSSSWLPMLENNTEG